MFNSPQISHVKDPKSSNHAPMNSIEPKSATKISIQLNSAKSTKNKSIRFKSATIEFNSAQISHEELNSAQINHLKNPKSLINHHLVHSKPKLHTKNSIQLKSTM
jgi:hypothetical protein